MQKGFTLVELIVVILIIAVLAAIVVSGVIVYVQKSKIAAMQENFHTLITGNTDYLQTNGSYGMFCNSLTTENMLFGIYNSKLDKGGIFCYDDSSKFSIDAGGNPSGSSNSGGNCNNNTNTCWAICIHLTTATSGASLIDWCADSAGKNEYVSPTQCTALASAPGNRYCP